MKFEFLMVQADDVLAFVISRRVVRTIDHWFTDAVDLYVSLNQFVELETSSVLYRKSPLYLSIASED